MSFFTFFIFTLLAMQLAYQSVFIGKTSTPIEQKTTLSDIDSTNYTSVLDDSCKVQIATEELAVVFCDTQAKYFHNTISDFRTNEAGTNIPMAPQDDGYRCKSGYNGVEAIAVIGSVDSIKYLQNLTGNNLRDEDFSISQSSKIIDVELDYNEAGRIYVAYQDAEQDILQRINIIDGTRQKLDTYPLNHISCIASSFAKILVGLNSGNQILSYFFDSENNNSVKMEPIETSVCSQRVKSGQRFIAITCSASKQVEILSHTEYKSIYKEKFEFQFNGFPKFMSAQQAQHTKSTKSSPLNHILGVKGAGGQFIIITGLQSYLMRHFTWFTDVYKDQRVIDFAGVVKFNAGGGGAPGGAPGGGLPGGGLPGGGLPGGGLPGGGLPGGGLPGGGLPGGGLPGGGLPGGGGGGGPSVFLQVYTSSSSLRQILCPRYQQVKVTGGGADNTCQLCLATISTETLQNCSQSCTTPTTPLLQSACNPSGRFCGGGGTPPACLQCQTYRQNFSRKFYQTSSAYSNKCQITSCADPNPSQEQCASAAAQAYATGEGNPICIPFSGTSCELCSAHSNCKYYDNGLCSSLTSFDNFVFPTPTAQTCEPAFCPDSTLETLVSTIKGLKYKQNCKWKFSIEQQKLIKLNWNSDGISILRINILKKGGGGVSERLVYSTEPQTIKIKVTQPQKDEDEEEQEQVQEQTNDDQNQEQQQQLPPIEEKPKGLTKMAQIGILIGSLFFLIFCVIAITFLCRRRAAKKSKKVLPGQISVRKIIAQSQREFQPEVNS